MTTTEPRTLNYEKVHVFEKIDGHERLTRVNPYKLFSKGRDPIPVPSRLNHNFITGYRSNGSETFHAQGGFWFDAARKEIPASEVPEWVWAECAAMSAEDRAIYRITLPGEVAVGFSLPTVDEEADWPPKQTLQQAMMRLDHDDPKMWTEEGIPLAKAVSKLVGATVTQARIDAVVGTFRRSGV